MAENQVDSNSSRKRYFTVLILISILLGFTVLFQNCSEGFEFTSVGEQSQSSSGDDSNDGQGDLPEPPPPPPATAQLGLTVTNTVARQSFDLKFEIKIAKALPQPVTVTYQTVNDTAIAATDYIQTSGTLTIPAGQTTAQVTVSTLIYDYATVMKRLRLQVTATSNGVTENQMGEGQIAPFAPTAGSYLVRDLPGITDVKQVAAAAWPQLAACALTNSGQILCWGGYRFGGPQNSLTPVTIATVPGAKAIAFGVNSACIIDAQDLVRCWGYIYINGAFTIAQTPTLIPNVGPVKKIVVGSPSRGGNRDMACAITMQDRLRCWGYRYYSFCANSFFDTDEFNFFPPTDLDFGPVSEIAPIGERTTLHAVSTGGIMKNCGSNGVADYVPNEVGVKFYTASHNLSGHQCFITAQNTVKCAGKGANGQLGNGQAQNGAQNNPTDVLNLTNVKELILYDQISIGDDESTCALTTGGDLYCWGLKNVLSHYTANKLPQALAPVRIGTSVKSMGTQMAYSIPEFESALYTVWGPNNTIRVWNLRP